MCKETITPAITELNRKIANSRAKIAARAGTIVETIEAISRQQTR